MRYVRVSLFCVSFIYRAFKSEIADLNEFRREWQNENICFRIILSNDYVNLRYYRNTLRDDAALLKGIPLSNAALCHVEALQIFYLII